MKGNHFFGTAKLLKLYLRRDRGWLPRISSVLNWLILGVFIFIEMLWEVGIVEWSALKWTPFAYAHYSIPIHELSIVPLIVLIVVAAVFTWLGLIGFRRRSIG